MVIEFPGIAAFIMSRGETEEVEGDVLANGTRRLSEFRLRMYTQPVTRA